MLRNLNGWPLVIIILAIIILVGWKRLPDAARSVGRSMRILKSEVEQMGGDKEDKPSAASTDTVDGQAGPAEQTQAEPTQAESIEEEQSHGTDERPKN